VGPFEFVIVLVLIITITNAISGRRGRQSELPSGAADNEELERLRETMGQLSSRLELLEQERDFYRDLLDAPANRRGISPPESSADSSGAG
jgi:hypothetical protein